MKMQVRLLILMSLTIALSACTGKSSERTQHEGPIKTTQPKLTEEEASDLVSQTYATSGNADQIINDKSVGIEKLMTAVEDLAKTVLNPSVLEQLDISNSPKFRSILSTLNRGLVRALEMDSKFVTNSGILDRYYAAALEGCDDNLKNCYTLRLFNDHLSSRIILAMAKNMEANIVSLRDSYKTGLRQKSDTKDVQVQYFAKVKAYYRLLFAAFERATPNSNDELNMAYVRMSQDYYAYFRNLPKNSGQEDALRRHTQNLNLSLMRIRDRLKSVDQRQEYCRFVAETNPLSFQMSEDKSLDRASMRFFVSEFLECSESGKDVLKNKISELLNEEKAQLQNKFNEDVNAFKKENADRKAKGEPENLLKISDLGIAYTMAELTTSPKIAKNLNIELNAKADPIAMFVIDRLYYEKIDQSMARSYWSKIGNQTDSQILRYIANYARAQMAVELKITLQNYGKILEQEFAKRKGLGTGFFDEVLKRVGSQSQTGWELMKVRQRSIRDFIARYYDQQRMPSIFVAELRKTLDEIESVYTHAQFTEMKNYLAPAGYDHMGVSVVAPMTMALYYYMAKAQGNIKIFIPWWPSSNQYFTINGQYALRNFLAMNGEMEYQFFKLGSSLYKFDHMSKLHALNFAIRSGLFDYVPFDLLEEDKKLFNEDTRLKAIPAEDVAARNQYLFFRQAFQDVFRFYEAVFQSSMTSMDRILRDRNFTERFLDSCRDPMGVATTIKLEDLRRGILFQEEHLFTGVRSIYNTGGFMPGWRDSRDSIKAYVQVLKQQLAKSPTESGNKTVQLIESDFAKFENLERTFYSKLFALDRLVVSNQNDCLLTLHKAEYLRRDLIYKENIEYYKNVHAAMQILKMADGQPTDVALNSLASLINNYLNENLKSASSQAGKDKIRDVAARMTALHTQLSATLAAMGNDLTIEQGLNRLLGIHNFDTAPFLTDKNEVGYFVTGVPTFSSSNKEIKSLNYINKETFSQSRWDALARIRRQLQTTPASAKEVNEALGANYYSADFILGRTIDIPLGSFSELEQNGIYLNNQTFKATYKSDQTEFVRQAMIQFAGYQGGNGIQLIDWNSNSGLGADLFERRFGWLLELSELGTLETKETDADVCPRDDFDATVAVRDLYGKSLVSLDEKSEKCGSVSVTPENILNTFIQLGEFTKLTDFDRELLEWIDRPGKNDSIVNRYFRYRDDITTKRWTWFDEFYRKFLVTRTQYNDDGSKVAIETLRGKEEFDKYRESYLQNIRSNRHLFALSSSPTQVERNLIRRRILEHMNQVKTYEAEIQNIENTRELGEIVFEKVSTQRRDEDYKFSNWRFVPVNRRARADKFHPKENTPIYLEDKERTKEWYATYIEHFFVRDTLCDVLPQTGDPDVADLGRYARGIVDKDIACQSRFNNWKAWNSQRTNP